jgi:hypothetical protein
MLKVVEKSCKSYSRAEKVRKTERTRYITTICVKFGARGGAVVEKVCYKPEGHGFDFRLCHWSFSLT